MDDDNSMVIIDLGSERGEPKSYVTPHRSTYPSWVVPALMSVLVLLCATASAAPAPSPLSTVLTLRMTPADGYAVTRSGQLLAQSFGTLSSYDLRTGRVRWSSGQLPPSYRLRSGDGLVLLRPIAMGVREPGTTAVSASDGAALWRRSDNVVMVGGSSALLAVRNGRTLIAGPSRIVGTVEGVDPITGDTRWTVDVPNTGVVLGVPGPDDSGARMLLLRDDQVATLHDLGTGREVARATLPSVDYTTTNPVVAGGLILLRHGGQQTNEISAYDPMTLKQRWSEPAPDAEMMTPCGDLACLTTLTGIRAIDPDTGDTVWQRTGWQAVGQEGTRAVAYADARGTDPVAVIDPDTGAVRLSLDGWQPVEGAGGELVFATREADGGGRTMVAVAGPGDTQPRLVEQLPSGIGDCQAVTDRLVCRSAYGELSVWAYRPKG